MSLTIVKDTRPTIQTQPPSGPTNSSPVKVIFNYNNTTSTGNPFGTTAPLITTKSQPSPNLVTRSSLRTTNSPTIVQGPGLSLIRTGQHPAPVNPNLHRVISLPKSSIIGGRNQILTPMLMSKVHCIRIQLPMIH
jgi:hypothetical protein